VLLSGSLPVSLSLPPVMPVWQPSVVGRVCAWFGCIALLPPGINSEEDAFRKYDVKALLAVWRLEEDWPCDERGTRLPFRVHSAKPSDEYRLFHKRCGHSFQRLVRVGLRSEKFLRCFVASSLLALPNSFSRLLRQTCMATPVTACASLQSCNDAICGTVPSPSTGTCSLRYVRTLPPSIRRCHFVILEDFVPQITRYWSNTCRTD